MFKKVENHWIKLYNITLSNVSNIEAVSEATALLLMKTHKNHNIQTSKANEYIVQGFIMSFIIMHLH